MSLGATAFFEVDLAPQQRSQTVYPDGYQQGGLGFTPQTPTRTETRTVTVGGWQMGLLLTLGLAVSR